MSRATRLRATLFADGASDAERLAAARAALDDDDDDDARAVVLAWTRARLRRAGRRDDASTTRERRGDDATRDGTRDEETLWRCFADANERATRSGRAMTTDASAGRREVMRALRRAAASRARAVDGETLRRAFDALTRDDGERRGARASCEECVEVAKSAMWDEGNVALMSAALAAAAAAANAQPNKPAPACVDFEFLWSVVETWSRAGEGDARRGAKEACDATMRAFVLHPMYARAIPNLVADAASAKKQKTIASTDDARGAGGARSSAPGFICDTIARVARAVESMDVDALRLAPWVLRATCEQDANERKPTASSSANKSSESVSKDARALFVELFEPIAAAFVAVPTGGKGERRVDEDAASALVDALVGLLDIAVDFTIYSPLEDEGRVESALQAFVTSIATVVKTNEVRDRGWSRVIGALSTLDLRLVEPHVKVMLTLLLVKSRDAREECVAVTQTMIKAFAEMRQLPEFMESVGEVVIEAMANGEKVNDALASEEVLVAFQDAAKTVPLRQTPDLMVICRKAFITAYDGDEKPSGARAPYDSLDKLARVLQSALGTCPIDAGEPLLPEAQACLEGFSEDIAQRLHSHVESSPARTGALLRAYVPVASLRQGLSEVADATARDSYFRSESVDLSAIVRHLVRDSPRANQEHENAESAAIGCAIQRVNNLSRLRYPREDVSPEESAKAGSEIKSLLSACLKLVPDTLTTSYDAPDSKTEAWKVLTSTIDLWYEQATDARILDYYRCRLETDIEGEGALSTEEEDKFSELVATFKPWVRAIASVITRGAVDLTRELKESLSRDDDSSAAGRCDVLEDIIADCVENKRQGEVACDKIKDFWIGPASTPITDGFGKNCTREDSAALKRMRRAVDAAERLHYRAVSETDVHELSIALQIGDCAMFNAASLGMSSAMDLCTRVRSRSAFLATHDEDSAMIVSGLITRGGHYLNVTNLALRNMLDVELASRLIESTTSAFQASLVGSALKVKAAVYTNAATNVARLLDDRFINEDSIERNVANVGGAFALSLVESLFAAANVVHTEPEREKYGWVDGNPDLDEEDELTDEQGDAIAQFWDAPAVMQVRARIESMILDMKNGLENGEFKPVAESVEVVASCVSAAGFILAVSATTLDYSEAFHRTCDADFVQNAIAVAIKVLLDTSNELSSRGTSRLVNFIGAACDALKQTGPQLTSEAHASLVAVLMFTYTRGTRALVDRDGAKSATPAADLHESLSLTMSELVYGAGKRPLTAMYDACVDAFKTTDAESRRAYLSSDRLDVSLAAPMWCLMNLVKSFHLGKAIRTAAQENVETVMDACMRAMTVAIRVPNANAVVHKLLEITTEFARLGPRCEISTRCVSRMCQLPSVACASDAVFDDGDAMTKIFCQACELIGVLLKSRKDHLRRAVSGITVACSDLLAALRRFKASGASAAVMESCAGKLSFVYESAEASGLDRYCTHLLADAITAITGGGIGVVAESALKPGLFALLDSSGDRELQQLHAALGAGAGGARRVVFAALREEHKHTHKFTGRV